MSGTWTRSPPSCFRIRPLLSSQAKSRLLRVMLSRSFGSTARSVVVKSASKLSVSEEGICPASPNPTTQAHRVRKIIGPPLVKPCAFGLQLLHRRTARHLNRLPKSRRPRTRLHNAFRQIASHLPSRSAGGDAVLRRRPHALDGPRHGGCFACRQLVEQAELAAIGRVPKRWRFEEVQQIGHFILMLLPPWRQLRRQVVPLR